MTLIIFVKNHNKTFIIAKKYLLLKLIVSQLQYIYFFILKIICYENTYIAEQQQVTPPRFSNVNILENSRLTIDFKHTVLHGKKYLKIVLIFFFVINLGYVLSAQHNTVNAQQKQVFEKEMNAYIATHLNKEIAEIKQNADLIENFDEYTEEDIRNMAKAYAKDKYIRHNMKDYLNTYFSTPQAMVTTDTFICDNGGFEDDFLYYKGYTATYEFGSNDCTPIYKNGDDVVFTQASLPTNKRFEIVTSGVDDLTGIQRVKFGNKALKINDRHGHIRNCYGDYGIDKIVKRFKVTEQNREFTVWYSVALENPAGHNDRQPFLNIKCDLAPDNELCFDADIIECAQYFSDPCDYDSIDVLDWSCHRFKIPEDKVGQIATLEIITADCGWGAHFGYAYFDGICEECDSTSALGSAILDEDINYISCDGDLARICGTYSDPKICGNFSQVDISVPGFDIENVTIDTSTKTFCLDFLKSNFTFDECLEIYVEIVFSNGVFDLPAVLSNSIEICEKRYTKSHNYTIEVGECDDNESDELSDDYYMVKLNILAPETDSWILERHLVDPYSNESGSYTLMTGTGDAQLELGPFLIQEGDWWLELSFSDCEYNELIEAPEFCAKCDNFKGLKISNVHCNKEDDTWSYDLRVDWTDATSLDYFKIESLPYNYNQTYSLSGGAISAGCINITLIASRPDDCEAKLKICPPKKCSEECNLEAYVVDVVCLNEKSFLVKMDISGIGNKRLCSDPGYTYYYPYYLYYLNSETNIYLKLCDYGENCNTCESDCYKIIYVPKPDCDYDPWKPVMPLKQKTDFNLSNVLYDEIIVYPNPILNNEIIIQSKLDKTEFSIYNTDGKIIKEGVFTGNEYKISFNGISGLYFIKYLNSQGKPAFIKMLKL